MRLLLVEDDATLLDVLHMAFRQRGWEVYPAQSPGEALAIFASAAPDVVLTDKNLPGGAIVSAQAGVELVRQIRQRDRFVGIILMTAFATVESARDTLNLGVDEYLEKPFDSLLAVVQRVSQLAERVAQRRSVSSTAPAPSAEPRTLTMVVAAAPLRQGKIHRILYGEGTVQDRLLSIERAADIKLRAQAERADAVILDGGSFPDEITSLVVQIKTRVRTAACIVLSQQLTVADVRRLIELEVRALVDEPLESERCAAQLRSVIDRLRR